MTGFNFQEMFPLGPDETQYRKLSGNFVNKSPFGEQTLLRIDSEALTRLTFEAFKDISHLLQVARL